MAACMVRSMALLLKALAICPSIGSSTATTIKSPSSSSLVQSVVGLFNARLC